MSIPGNLLYNIGGGLGVPGASAHMLLNTAIAKRLSPGIRGRLPGITTTGLGIGSAAAKVLAGSGALGAAGAAVPISLGLVFTKLPEINRELIRTGFRYGLTEKSMKPGAVTAVMSAISPEIMAGHGFAQLIGSQLRGMKPYDRVRTVNRLKRSISALKHSRKAPVIGELYEMLKRTPESEIARPKLGAPGGLSIFGKNIEKKLSRGESTTQAQAEAVKRKIGAYGHRALKGHGLLTIAQGAVPAIGHGLASAGAALGVPGAAAAADVTGNLGGWHANPGTFLEAVNEAPSHLLFPHHTINTYRLGVYLKGRSTPLLINNALRGFAGKPVPLLPIKTTAKGLVAKGENLADSKLGRYVMTGIGPDFHEMTYALYKDMKKHPRQVDELKKSFTDIMTSGGGSGQRAVKLMGALVPTGKLEDYAKFLKERPDLITQLLDEKLPGVVRGKRGGTLLLRQKLGLTPGTQLPGVRELGRRMFGLTPAKAS